MLGGWGVWCEVEIGELLPRHAPSTTPPLVRLGNLRFFRFSTPPFLPSSFLSLQMFVAFFPLRQSSRQHFALFPHSLLFAMPLRRHVWY